MVAYPKIMTFWADAWIVELIEKERARLGYKATKSHALRSLIERGASSTPARETLHPGEPDEEPQ